MEERQLQHVHESVLHKLCPFFSYFSLFGLDLHIAHVGVGEGGTL